MSIKVKELAEKLELEEPAVIEFLSDLGIYVNDIDDILSDEEAKKFRENMRFFTSGQKSKALLQKCAKEYKIFLDTSSLLKSLSDVDVSRFWSNIIPLLELYKNRIIVPINVQREVEESISSSYTKSKAQKIRQIITKLKEAQIIQIKGEDSFRKADDVFLYVINKFKSKYKILLITEDRLLAKNILNKSKSSNVIVKSLDNEGSLKDIFSKPVFELAGSLTKISNESLKVTCIPTVGDIVYNGKKPKPKKKPKPQHDDVKKAKKEDKSIFSMIHDFFFGSKDDVSKENSSVEQADEKSVDTRKKIKLLKLLGKGGEAAVYTTNTQYVAKIYNRDKITKYREAKIKLMTSKNIQYPGICYPQEILYNAKDEFVGYLMLKAKGVELQKSIFLKPLFLKQFPDWKKRDIVQLCITILDKIRFLHRHNIILGDINPFNIMVCSPTEVYFVDVDSYQVEGFPCPVGTIPFTAQEILRENRRYKQTYNRDRHYNEYLRSFSSDYFAVAVLLFMIVMMGKNPYSLQGGESMESNMLNMDFAYPLNELKNDRTPEGAWIYIWSHLPYFIKTDFYNTFHKDGRYSRVENRLSVERWLDDFNKYLKLLDNGSIGSQDEMSEAVFPTRYKKAVVRAYANLSIFRRIINWFRRLFKKLFN